MKWGGDWDTEYFYLHKNKWELSLSKNSDPKFFWLKA